MQFGSSNGVSIDLAASQSSADSIGTIVGEMKGILNQIRTSAGTGQASWSGQAATAFGNTHNNWQDLATRLNTALDEIEANHFALNELGTVAASKSVAALAETARERREKREMQKAVVAPA